MFIFKQGILVEKNPFKALFLWFIVITTSAPASSINSHNEALKKE